MSCDADQSERSLSAVHPDQRLCGHLGRRLSFQPLGEHRLTQAVVLRPGGGGKECEIDDVTLCVAPAHHVRSQAALEQPSCRAGRVAVRKGVETLEELQSGALDERARLVPAASNWFIEIIS